MDTDLVTETEWNGEREEESDDLEDGFDGVVGFDEWGVNENGKSGEFWLSSFSLSLLIKF